MVIFDADFFQFHEMKLKKKLLRQTSKLPTVARFSKKPTFFDSET